MGKFQADKVCHKTYGTFLHAFIDFFSRWIVIRLVRNQEQSSCHGKTFPISLCKLNFLQKKKKKKDWRRSWKAGARKKLWLGCQIRITKCLAGNYTRSETWFCYVHWKKQSLIIRQRLSCQVGTISKSQPWNQLNLFSSSYPFNSFHRLKKS